MVFGVGGGGGGVPEPLEPPSLAAPLSELSSTFMTANDARVAENMLLCLHFLAKSSVQVITAPRD